MIYDMAWSTGSWQVRQKKRKERKDNRIVRHNNKAKKNGGSVSGLIGEKGKCDRESAEKKSPVSEPQNCFF